MFEDYQKDLNPFHTSTVITPTNASTVITPSTLSTAIPSATASTTVTLTTESTLSNSCINSIQYYLYALWKCENINYFISFVSKYFNELSRMKLTFHTYSIILKITSETKNKKLFYSWYSVIRKQLDQSLEQSLSTGQQSLDHNILCKALELSFVFHSPTLSMEIYGDLKRIRKSMIKLKNSRNSLAINPIEMALLFEKSIRSNLYPFKHDQNQIDEINSYILFYFYSSNLLNNLINLIVYKSL